MSAPVLTTPPQAELPVKLVCPHCGSEEVRRDANAAWSVELQQWELNAVFDSAACDGCGRDDIRIKELPISD